jgi:hypothetical protein
MMCVVIGVLSKGCNRDKECHTDTQWQCISGFHGGALKSIDQNIGRSCNEAQIVPESRKTG